MEYARTPIETHQDRFRIRARSARKWARLVRAGLVVTCLTAIWQERALMPTVHDRMKISAAWAGEMIERSEGAKSYLTAMSGFSGSGNQSEFDPITETLLKLRN